MIIDASDGNWQQLVRQLTALSREDGLQAELICPSDLRHSAIRLLSRLDINDRVFMVGEQDAFDSVTQCKPEPQLKIRAEPRLRIFNA